MTAAELKKIADSAPYSPPIDYRANPLGTMEGEEGLAVPYNAITEAVVSVRNWSAVIERRILVEAISPQRGGGRAIADKNSPYYGKSVDELHRVAKDEQRDMSWYKMAIVPISFGLRFDGNVIEIKPDLEEVDVKVEPTEEEIAKARAENKPIAPRYEVQKQPKWHLIPPGAWDLYMGNYERMRSPRHLERTREMEALTNRALNRWCLGHDEGRGFLEFKREEVRYETQRVDRTKIDASQIIEV